MPGALVLEEREEIRAGLSRGDSCRAIAARLGRSSSTVSREVRRHGGRHRYRACEAQRRAERARRRPKTPKLVADRLLARAVSKELRQGFSPVAVSRRLAARGEPTVAAETIYQALYSKQFRGLELLPTRCLRSRRRYRRTRKARQKMAGRSNTLGEFRSVHQRPFKFDDRSEIGHWEGDLIMGAFNRSAVVTLVERSTRLTLLGHLAGGHSAPEVLEALKVVFAQVPRLLRRTLTWDRGREMADWPLLEDAAGLRVYFCDPSSPWQRGSNEHTNRQLRFWFPKGSDLRQFDRSHLTRVEQVLNGTPRRLHNWTTPAELYAHAAMH